MRGAVSVASHNKALTDLETEYKDKIQSLQNSQLKLLKQTIEEQERIVMPTLPFWTITCICGLIILCGFISWLKFWHTPGNDATMSYMFVAIFVEIIYYASMAWNYYTDEERQKTKEKQNNPIIFSISLSQAVYIMALTFSAAIYIVWSQMTVTSDTWFLLYLLPVVFVSNFTWLLTKALVVGIFGKA